MPIFIFSYYKSMAAISCIATRVLIRLGQKTILFVPPIHRFYMWTMVRIGFMASEEMSFENVDDGRKTKDGWMDDECLPVLQVHLWAFGSGEQKKPHLSLLTSVVVGAPQMTLQQYISTLVLSSAALRESLNTMSAHSLMLSSHLFFCLPLLHLSLSPAELSSPCRKICGHTIWVSVSYPWLGDHHVLQLHFGLCCEPPRSSDGLCRKCSKVSYSIRIRLSNSAVKVQLLQA